MSRGRAAGRAGRDRGRAGRERGRAGRERGRSGPGRVTGAGGGGGGAQGPRRPAPRRSRRLSIMVSIDEGLSRYLGEVLGQITAWLESGKLQRLVLVLSAVASREVLERWTFNIRQEEDGDGARVQEGVKSERELQSEIGAIIRQITASVTFLPLIDEPCSFDLLVYADEDAQVPQSWEDSDPRYLEDSAEVMLRSFSTKVHRVESMVAFKRG